MASEEFDLIVIGGGTSGIVAARFYLDIHPRCRLAVIEGDGTVGGVWSKERVYDGFKSQASTRMGGFSDLPFTPPANRVDENDFFDAKCMAEYLEQYIDHHSYAGETLRDRIKFNTSVTRLEKIDGLWHVHCNTSSGSPLLFIAPKVIVASGRTSYPNQPHLLGNDVFEGRIVHTIDFGRSRILEVPGAKKVTVLGGGKSAADIVYQSVKAGKDVSWIIRQSGKGPGKFMDGKGFGPYRNITEVGLTRLLSKVLLSGMAPDTWWSAFLFGTSLGRWFYTKFQEMGDRQVEKLADFDRRPGARESFKNLKNDFSAGWLTGSAGLVQYDGFWDIIAKNVDVYRSDIDRLGEKSMYLTNGVLVEADAILCGTGFKETMPFFSTSQRLELGLPHDLADEPPESAAVWTSLEKDAEKEILKRFLLLASPPSLPEELGDIPSTTPYRLYNNIAPLNDSSIAFIGFAAMPNMFCGSEVEAIWATAFLDGNLKLPDPATMRADVAWVNAYIRLRCPTYGIMGNFYTFDFFPYIDKLLGELGLTSYRKGWWSDMVTPLFMSDLKGLRDEYSKKYPSKEKDE